MTRVYISSSHEDLRGYREAASLALQNAGAETVATEDDGPSGSSPLAQCLEHVERCDVFVLILARRLGWRPPDDPRGANPENLSITELEYEHALRLGRPVLAFALHPGEAWPAQFPEYAEAAESFRRRVAERTPLVDFQADPTDLAAKVAEAFTTWRERRQEPASGDVGSFVRTEAPDESATDEAAKAQPAPEASDPRKPSQWLRPALVGVGVIGALLYGIFFGSPGDSEDPGTPPSYVCDRTAQVGEANPVGEVPTRPFALVNFHGSSGELVYGVDIDGTPVLDLPSGQQRTVEAQGCPLKPVALAAWVEDEDYLLYVVNDRRSNDEAHCLCPRPNAIGGCPQPYTVEVYDVWGMEDEFTLTHVDTLAAPDLLTSPRSIAAAAARSLYVVNGENSTLSTLLGYGLGWNDSELLRYRDGAWHLCEEGISIGAGVAAASDTILVASAGDQRVLAFDARSCGREAPVVYETPARPLTVAADPEGWLFATVAPNQWGFFPDLERSELRMHSPSGEGWMPAPDWAEPFRDALAVLPDVGSGGLGFYRSVDDANAEIWWCMPEGPARTGS